MQKYAAIVRKPPSLGKRHLSIAHDIPQVLNCFHDLRSTCTAEIIDADRKSSLCLLSLAAFSVRGPSDKHYHDGGFIRETNLLMKIHI